MKLEERRVLLTGAGSGIGRELALALASKGGRLVLMGRRESPLAETAELVAGAGGTAVAVAGDVADGAHRRAALEAAEREFGGLDVLINNAANIAAGRLESVSEADIRWMVEVNLLAPVLATRAALPLLRRSGAAMVVNLASGFALVGTPFYSVYCAAKAGLVRFGEALRRELLDEGVHVMTAYPSATDTPLMATSEVGTKQGVVLQDPASVAAGIVGAMEADALSVVFGGEERKAQFATNVAEPEKLDEFFAERKQGLEEAVRRHRAM